MDDTTVAGAVTVRRLLNPCESGDAIVTLLAELTGKPGEELSDSLSGLSPERRAHLDKVAAAILADRADLLAA